MPSFGTTSTIRLRQCDVRLQNVLNEIVKYYDCTIITGHRTKEEQNKKFDKELTQVKWPNSKHNSFPSKAVDVAPWPIPEQWGEDHWKDMVKFYEFKAILFYEASKWGVKIRYGGDWNMDGDYKDNKFDDLIHFEVI